MLFPLLQRDVDSRLLTSPVAQLQCAFLLLRSSLVNVIEICFSVVVKLMIAFLFLLLISGTRVELIPRTSWFLPPFSSADVVPSLSVSSSSAAFALPHHVIFENTDRITEETSNRVFLTVRSPANETSDDLWAIDTTYSKLHTQWP